MSSCLDIMKCLKGNTVILHSLVIVETQIGEWVVFL